MENVRRVLESYRVYPVEIEAITDRLYRVIGNKQTYALKRSAITDDRIPIWLNIYRTANTLNLVNILPVYLNQTGELFTKDSGEIYYLSPWIHSESRNHSIERIYQSLGYIHAKTKHSQTITQETRESSKESFLDYKQKMSQLRKKLLANVEIFESRHYMSPVELLVCTQYRDLVKVFYVLDKRIDQFIDEDNSQAEWNTSLCHGNMTESHLLQSNQMYFINWEHASYQHPVMDMTRFLKDKTLNYDVNTDVLLEKFNYYMAENQLNNSELFLLTIYLLDPSDYIYSIDTYTEDNPSFSIIEQVIHLQHLHRQLLFGLRFSDYVEAEYEMVPFDESGSNEV